MASSYLLKVSLISLVVSFATASRVEYCAKALRYEFNDREIAIRNLSILADGVFIDAEEVSFIPDCASEIQIEINGIDVFLQELSNSRRNVSISINARRLLVHKFTNSAPHAEISLRGRDVKVDKVSNSGRGVGIKINGLRVTMQELSNSADDVDMGIDGIDVKLKAFSNSARNLALGINGRDVTVNAITNSAQGSNIEINGRNVMAHKLPDYTSSFGIKAIRRKTAVSAHSNPAFVTSNNVFLTFAIHGARGQLLFVPLEALDPTPVAAEAPDRSPVGPANPEPVAPATKEPAPVVPGTTDPSPGVPGTPYLSITIPEFSDPTLAFQETTDPAPVVPVTDISNTSPPLRVVSKITDAVFVNPETSGPVPTTPAPFGPESLSQDLPGDVPTTDNPSLVTSEKTTPAPVSPGILDLGLDVVETPDSTAGTPETADREPASSTVHETAPDDRSAENPSRENPDISSPLPNPSRTIDPVFVNFLDFAGRAVAPTSKQGLNNLQ